MKSLAALDRPSWLSSSAWPWQPYLLSHHQGGIAVTDIGDGPAVLFVHVGSWSFVWRDVLLPGGRSRPKPGSTPSTTIFV